MMMYLLMKLMDKIVFFFSPIYFNYVKRLPGNYSVAQYVPISEFLI